MSVLDAMRSALASLPDAAGMVCTRHDPDLWFADDPVGIEQAIEACRECPIKAACLTGAQERYETWGVWGGVDFHPAARKVCACGCGQPVGRGRNRKLATPLCYQQPQKTAS